MQGLRVRLLADTSGGEEALAADLPGAPPGTWPLAGLAIEGDPPARVRVPMSWVLRGLAEGWLDGEGRKVVTRPAGTAAAPWTPTVNAPTPHIFHHYAAIILKTVTGPARYRVTHQPDKYAADGDDATPVTDEVYAAGATRVDWFYDLELEAGG